MPLLVVCDRRGGTRVGRHALALQQRIEVRIVVLEEGYDRVESVSIPKVECDPAARLGERELAGGEGTCRARERGRICSEVSKRPPLRCLAVQPQSKETERVSI